MTRPLPRFGARAAVALTMALIAVSAHIASVQARLAYWIASEGRR